MLRQSLPYALLAACILTALLWIGSYTFLQGQLALTGPRQYFDVQQRRGTFAVAVAGWYGPTPWESGWKAHHESYIGDVGDDRNPNFHQLGPFTFLNEHIGPGNVHWVMAIGCSHWCLFLLTAAAATYAWRKRRLRQSAFPVLPPANPN